MSDKNNKELDPQGQIQEIQSSSPDRARQSYVTIGMSDLAFIHIIEEINSDHTISAKSYFSDDEEESHKKIKN